ncbi:MAG: hypothetical protein ABW321_25790 [Polyangiales bacterium]
MQRGIGMHSVGWLGLCLLIGCGDDDAVDPSADAGRGGEPAPAPGGRSGHGGGGHGGGSGQGGVPSHGGGGRAGSVAGGAGAAGPGGGGTGGVNDPGARLGSCPAFPADDAWNRVVEHDPVSTEWTSRVQALVGEQRRLHPDYGNAGDEHYGIPINVVPATQPEVPIAFDDYPDESDPGPYPFPAPADTRVEGGTATACDGDCHVLVVREGECKLYEGYACRYDDDGWHCSNGAVWDLQQKSEGQREAGWTSADAAGLAIAPGLVRYEEAQSGEINHAIRFTLRCTRANYVAPASHYAVPGGCRDNADAPPMGLRVRLRADYDLSALSGSARAVARAMQRYGMILADNGSDFYFQGEQDPRFGEDDVEPLKDIPASQFEALEPGALLP